MVLSRKGTFVSFGDQVPVNRANPRSWNKWRSSIWMVIPKKISNNTAKSSIRIPFNLSPRSSERWKHSASLSVHPIENETPPWVRPISIPSFSSLSHLHCSSVGQDLSHGRHWTLRKWITRCNEEVMERPRRSAMFQSFQRISVEWFSEIFPR